MSPSRCQLDDEVGRAMLEPAPLSMSATALGDTGPGSGHFRRGPKAMSGPPRKPFPRKEEREPVCFRASRGIPCTTRSMGTARECVDIRSGGGPGRATDTPAWSRLLIFSSEGTGGATGPPGLPAGISGVSQPGRRPFQGIKFPTQVRDTKRPQMANTCCIAHDAI